MEAVSLPKDQVQQTPGVVEGTVGDLMPEQMAWKPGGRANPVAGLLIHLISGEDLFLKLNARSRSR